MLFGYKIVILKGEITIGEYFCVPRESLHCFYITKENVEEFVDKYGYNDEHTITITDDFAYAKYKNMTWNIRLNAFMVYETDGWTPYTYEEFNKIYKIIL